MAASSDSVVRSLPDQAVVPLYSFDEQDQFVWRHEQGTLIEMENEEKVVERLNQRRYFYQVWPVAPIPGLTTPFFKSWLLLVQVPGGEARDAFPSMSDTFTIDMETKVDLPEGTFSLVHMAASRVPNPYDNHVGVRNEAVKRCAAFKVDVPRSWQTDTGSHVELDLMAAFQTASSISDVANITVDHRKHQCVNIQWTVSSLTFEAELAALHHLVDDHRLAELAPSKRSLNAFRVIQDFTDDTWFGYRDLHDEFPQLQNPAYPPHRVPKLLVDKFRAFNADHKKAWEGLGFIPNSLYFVNGCPGAGKTEWNMVLSGIIHSKASPKSRLRHTPILFIVDLNKAVDDAANRYHNLCRDAGLNLRIIRMHSWPYEIRNSSRLNTADSEASQAELDFTSKFLATASLARHAKAGRNPRVAPSLDQASWEHYEQHKHDSFQALGKLLARMEREEVFGSEDWRALRNQVSVLYRAVLAQADFVATTPVATYGRFSKLFKPDIVFMDEAPHARELTSLIPIAFFSPLAWIFTGDVKQTRPFVKSDDRHRAEREGLRFNPFADQLRISTMARAEMVGAINSKLLVNKRSHGNLHRLPSKMFYDSHMRSGYDEASMYPPSTLYLKGYLERLGGIHDISENRLVVRLKYSEEEKFRASFWNPAHHEWVLLQVSILLRDDAFRSVTGSGAGTIMIATPYSTAMREYSASVKKWRDEWQGRVEVLTVDKAQGNQADVVFLDMVRSTGPGFMDDPQRLNVAMTRARQAEVIVMNRRMTTRTALGNVQIKTKYLSQIWDDAVAQGTLANL